MESNFRLRLHRLADIIEQRIFPHQSWSVEEYIGRNPSRLGQYLSWEKDDTNDEITLIYELLASLQGKLHPGLSAILVGSTTLPPDMRTRIPSDRDVKILLQNPSQSDERQMEILRLRSDIRTSLRSAGLRYDESDCTTSTYLIPQRMGGPFEAANFDFPMPQVTVDENDPSFVVDMGENLPWHLSIAGLNKPSTIDYLEGEALLGHASGIIFV